MLNRTSLNHWCPPQNPSADPLYDKHCCSIASLVWTTAYPMRIQAEFISSQQCPAPHFTTRTIFLKEMPPNIIKHKMQMEVALALLVGHLWFSPHFFNPVSSPFHSSVLLGNLFLSFMSFITGFMAVSKWDCTEETKCPVAGIAYKALASKGVTPDRCPSFSVPKDVGLCSKGDSCSTALCSTLGSISGNHLGTCLILKTCFTPCPKQVLFPQRELRKTPSSISRVSIWNFS